MLKQLKRISFRIFKPNKLKMKKIKLKDFDTLIIETPPELLLKDNQLLFNKFDIVDIIIETDAIETLLYINFKLMLSQPTQYLIFANIRDWGKMRTAPTSIKLVDLDIPSPFDYGADASVERVLNVIKYKNVKLITSLNNVSQEVMESREMFNFGMTFEVDFEDINKHTYLN